MFLPEKQFLLIYLVTGFLMFLSRGKSEDCSSSPTINIEVSIFEDEATVEGDFTFDEKPEKSTEDSKSFNDNTSVHLSPEQLDLIVQRVSDIVIKKVLKLFQSYKTSIPLENIDVLANQAFNILTANASDFDSGPKMDSFEGPISVRHSKEADENIDEEVVIEIEDEADVEQVDDSFEGDEVEYDHFENEDDISNAPETDISPPHHNDSKVASGYPNLCNITNTNWTRVVFIDVYQDRAICPIGLQEVYDKDSNMLAYGRTVDIGCSSVKFKVKKNYTQVCGRARGYQFGAMEAFQYSPNKTIDEAYVDGLSITHGNPRKHLWTFAVGLDERYENRHSLCPMDQTGQKLTFRVPDFVGLNYYCETGFLDFGGTIMWKDPLWDGEECILPSSRSCKRHGWFHRVVDPTDDYIEVRWCSFQERKNEDVLTDLVEVWVL